MWPNLTESDFLTIVTYIKGELTHILATASTVDSIKTYISDLVRYIEATKQTLDPVCSDDIKEKEEHPEEPTQLSDEPNIIKQELDALFPNDEQNKESADQIEDIDSANDDDDDDDDDDETEKASDAKSETDDVSEGNSKDPNSCSGCGKAFETTELLQEHIAVNSGDKRFKCSGCCKAFKHKVSLKLHIVEENHGLDKEDPVEFHKFLKKLVVCSLCKKRFYGQGNLDRHMLTHTGGKPFQCKICLKQFKQKRSLVMHSEREGHSQDIKKSQRSLPRTLKERRYRCLQCDQIYNTQNQLNSHMKVHARGSQFGCNICGRYFTRKETLEKHIARDCSGDVFPVPVMCGTCKETFTRRSLLDIHLTKHVDPVNNAEEKAGQQNVNMENFLKNAETGDFGNDEINALANQIAIGILGGQPSEVVNTTGAEGSQATNQDLQIPERRGRGRPRVPMYQCQYCTKTFKRRREWRNHQYLHTGEKPHVCDICGKAFRLRQVLSLHIATHDGNKYKCNTCDKTYPYKNQLVRHSFTHSGIKPYKCEQCGKGFISKPELGRHYGVHGERKTFVCDICGKSCQNLKKHIAARHSHREKVPCEICHKEYVSKSKLKVHMLTHTSPKAFVCPLCGKGFAMNKYLSKHMVLSHGEKKHKCQLCGKGFAFSQQLKIHERTHTVERPMVDIPMMDRPIVDIPTGDRPYYYSYWQ